MRRITICAALSVTWMFGMLQIRAASKILETTPEISALIAKGEAHEDRKQYDQAIFDFSEALLLKPSPLVAAELYGQRGGNYVLKRDFERAMADAEEAVRLAPDYFRGYQTRARLFGTKLKYNRAIADINHAIQLQPDFACLYMNRGNLLANMGDKARAIADYNKAIKLDSRGAYTYLNRGACYQEMGRTKEALADYHQAIILAPSLDNSYYNRALIYLKSKDYARATADLDRYIQLTPTGGLSYMLRAQALIAQRDYQRAEADLRKAKELAPQDVRVLNNIAWLQATCPEDSERDGEAAVDAARQACELTKWKNKSYIDTLAAAYAEAGYFGKAVNFEERAIKGLSAETGKDREARLALYREHKPYHETPAKVVKPIP